MTSDQRDRPSARQVVGYFIGALWLFMALAVLLTIPVATLIGLWVGGRAFLIYMGVL